MSSKLKIITDIDCQVYCDYEYVGDAISGCIFHLNLRKGIYLFEFKKDTEKNKVKVESGNKVSSQKAKKKVKVSGGAKVSKSKKSESTLSQKKSSKYEGVFYEEGLFMWSAEVDGKHLGLFPTEEEAHEKREEYIKNRS